MFVSLISAILLAPFLAIALLRNMVFDLISRVSDRDIDKYKKERLVDYGLITMFTAVEIGVIMVSQFPSLSIGTVVICVVFLCSVGAVVLATGIRDEWASNH